MDLDPEDANYKSSPHIDDWYDQEEPSGFALVGVSILVIIVFMGLLTLLVKVLT